jgi:hypothetical protein
MVKNAQLKMILISGLILCCGTHPARAEDESRPAIIRIEIYVNSEKVSCDVTSKGLFSEKIIGTVQSGLPAVIELFYQMMAGSEGTVLRGVHSYSLGYDVWDDVYSISAEDSVEHFTTFDAMRLAIENLRNVPIVPIADIAAELEYSISMSLAVNPLQGSDKRKIEGWVSDNMRSDQDKTRREQVLNLNDLINHFFTREDIPANRSEWFETPIFKPAELRVRPREENN